MVFDLHAHTCYSGCGRDAMQDLVQTAVDHGIALFGISDHNYGIGARKAQYIRDVRNVAARFEEKTQVLCGMEIATLPHLFDIADPAEIAACDYVLLEHIDHEESLAWEDLFGFCARLGVLCGIAHTDLFAYCEKRGYEPHAFFAELAKYGVFWEMNVNYDSIHGYREHAYVQRMMDSPWQQAVLREAGTVVSVGFDGHRMEEYNGERVRRMCAFLNEQGIRTADTLFR